MSSEYEFCYYGVGNCSSFFPVFCIKSFSFLLLTFHCGETCASCFSFLHYFPKSVDAGEIADKIFWEMLSTLKSSYTMKILLLSNNWNFFGMSSVIYLLNDVCKDTVPSVLFFKGYPIVLSHFSVCCMVCL